MQLNPRYIAVASALLMFATPGVAHAYLGPGLGLGAIGVALGVIGSILLGIVSVIWYPFKRMLRKMRGNKAAASAPAPAAAAAAAPAPAAEPAVTEAPEAPKEASSAE